MKKILPILMVIGLVGLIVVTFLSMSKEKKMLVVKEDNTSLNPVSITANHTQGAQCGMTLQNEKDSAQVIIKSGKTWFFDDVGCLSLWIANKDFKNSAKIFVFSNDTNKFIDAKKAWYSTNDITPMRYGFGAYSKKKDGFITYADVLAKMSKGENARNHNMDNIKHMNKEDMHK